jgi:hypothetical protein
MPPSATTRKASHSKSWLRPLLSTPRRSDGSSSRRAWRGEIPVDGAVDREPIALERLCDVVVGMSNVCFRIRINLPVRTRVDLDQTELLLHDDGTRQVTLLAGDRDKTLQEAKRWVVRGTGFADEEAAMAEAARWRSRLMLALAYSRIGADFGDRATNGAFTAAGLSMLEARTGVRVLNDTHGIMTYESGAATRFASMDADAVVGRSAERFKDGVVRVTERGVQMGPDQELAFELFSASFNESYADSRFLLLMMACETLLHLEPRSESARNLVDAFLVQVAGSVLDDKEKASLRGSLRWLRAESINQAGQRLARTLFPNEYMNMPADVFFKKCYDLRSKLVHGSYPRPTREVVDAHGAQLETFVADLLSLELADVPGGSQ